MENQDITTELRDPRELRPHPDNPRGVIDAESEAIVSLAADIAKHGVLQPLVISSTGMVHIGHRRRIAAIKAGVELVPVIVRDLQGGELVEEIFLAENMQRKDLSPLEEARAIAAIKKKLEKQTKGAFLKTDLARRLHMPAQTISQRLAILDLPGDVQQLFHTLEIPLGSATQLARLKEWPDEVLAIANRLVSRQLRASDLDKVITERIRKLQNIKDGEAILKRAPRLERLHQHNAEGMYTAPVTRDSVIEILQKKGPGTVTLFNVNLIMEQTCCACGMIGNNAVCLTCPLPKFVQGLVGRANGTNDRNNVSDEDLD